MPYIPEIQIGNKTFRIKDLESQDSIKVMQKACNLIRIGTAYNNEMLFEYSELPDEKIIYYEFDCYDGYNGGIGFFNNENQRLYFIGKESSSDSENHYSGFFHVPDTFVYAKAQSAHGNTPYKIDIKWLSAIPKEVYNRTKDETVDKLLLGLPVSYHDAGNVALTKYDFVNGFYDYRQATRGFIYHSTYLTSGFIKVYKGDVLDINPGSLYARAYFFETPYDFVRTQDDFYNEVNTYKIIEDGYVILVLKKDENATTPITRDDYSTGGASIVINRIRDGFIKESNELLLGLPISCNDSGDVVLTDDDFINGYYDYRQATRGFVYYSTYLISGFIKVYKGDVLEINPGSLYARAYFFETPYKFTSVQSDFFNVPSSYSAPKDGFMLLILKKNSAASETITKEDVSGSDASFVLHRTKMKHLQNMAANADFFNKTYQIKNRLRDFEGYKYLAFSGGVMYKGQEIHVCRAGNAHKTPGDSSLWGTLCFFFINEDGSITHQLFEVPEAFSNHEFRDPILSVTRSNRLILSGFGTGVNQDDHRNYMFLLEMEDGVLVVKDTCYDYVPDITTGGVVQDTNGYLYKATYGDGDSTIINIYKSNTPYIGNDDLPNDYTLWYSYEDSTYVTETAISIYNDEELLILIRKEDVGPRLLRVNLSTAVLSSNSIIGTDIIHSPVLFPYYHDSKVLVSGSGVDDEQGYRSPFIAYLDIDSGTWVSKEYVVRLVSLGGYPSIVPLGQNNYGLTYYHNDSANGTSGFYYIRVNLDKLLNNYYL